ncbi:MAG: hypothetical protein IT481_08535 [Gammaproteobacteria bacterium]|nr:hypothetical protein [Gammaproteobacteria bacterium]
MPKLLYIGEHEPPLVHGTSYEVLGFVANDGLLRAAIVGEEDEPYLTGPITNPDEWRLMRDAGGVVAQASPAPRPATVAAEPVVEVPVASAPVEPAVEG